MLYAGLVTGLAVAGVGCSRAPEDSAAAPSQSPAAPAQAIAPAPAKPTLSASERAATLDTGFRQIEDGLKETPRDTWDPRYVVERIGRDAQGLHQWVRDSTSWIPYRGTLRGAAGVLMDRKGNNLDRSLLLATLLREAGHTVRLAHGELTIEQAAAVLPRIMPLAPTDSAESESLDTLDPVLKSYGERGRQQMASTRSTATQQAALLRQKLGTRGSGPDAKAMLDSAIEQLREHWWVQLLEADKWVDLDLLAETGTAAVVASIEQLELDSIPAALSHEVEVRVVAEYRSASGKTKQSTVLQHSLRPAELLGRRIALRFWPGNWPTQYAAGSDPNLGLRTAALDQTAWMVNLIVDRGAVASTVLEASAAPSANQSQGGGPMGGLTGRAFGGQAAPARARDLTAVWIEYEIRVPGSPPQHMRREVFDVPGPLDEDQLLTRNFAMMREVELLPLICEPSPQFVMNLMSQSLLANRALLQTPVADRDSEEFADLARAAAATPTPLYGVALARFQWSAVRDQLYVDRPGLLTRHLFPKWSNGRAVWQDATDIVANEIGIDFAAEDSFAARVEQGVLDTTIEALRYADPAANTAHAFARTGKAWLTLTQQNNEQLQALKLADEDRQRISSDLEAGYVVVAPRAPVMLGSQQFVGWWRVDPATGHTLGIDAYGRGGTVAEYLKTAAQAAASEFLMCEGLHEFVAETRDGLEFGAGATSGFGVCVIQGVAAGFFATLPILVLQIHNTVMAKVLYPAALPSVPVALIAEEVNSARALRARFGAARPAPGGLVTDETGYPKLAGLEWPESLNVTKSLTPAEAGTAASQARVDRIIASLEQTHAVESQQFPRELARFREAAFESEQTKHLPASDANRRMILRAEDEAGRAMDASRRSLEHTEKLLRYWRSVKPLNDRLAAALPVRNAAVDRYNRRLFSAPLVEHMDNVAAARNAHGRVALLQQQIAEALPGRAATAAGPNTGLGGISGVVGGL